MSSFEANTYPTKPQIQGTSSSISMNKAIFQGGIVVPKDKADSQTKRVQPLMRPVVIDHYNSSQKTHLNNSTVRASRPVGAEFHHSSSVEVTRKQAVSKIALTTREGISVNQRVSKLAGQSFTSTMGNEHTRPIPSALHGAQGTPLVQQTATAHGAVPASGNMNPMASMGKPGVDPSRVVTTTITPVIAPGAPGSATVSKVVTTQNIRSLPQGNGMTVRAHVPSPHGAAQPLISGLMQHATVINTPKQAAPAHIRGSATHTQPIRAITAARNPTSSAMGPSTTVQIRIQNQHTSSNANVSRDRTTPQTRAPSYQPYSQSQLPARQLVITQNSGANMHHTKPAISQPIDTRVTTTPAVSHAIGRKQAGRSNIFQGHHSHHDYTRCESLAPPVASTHIRRVNPPDALRPTVTVQTVNESQGTVTYTPLSHTSSTAVSLSPINPLTSSTANSYSLTSGQPALLRPPGIPVSQPVTINCSSHTVLAKPQSSIQSNKVSADNPAAVEGSSGSSSRPSPSILKRKRTLDPNHGPPGSKRQLYSGPGIHSSNIKPPLAPMEKDTNSQSSTDTAASESPTIGIAQVKNEPADPAADPPKDQPDVSPRKKPRKQLLNSAAELKDQHDSSTEEETETKQGLGMKFEMDSDMSPPQLTEIKKEFIDRDGVRWVRMRQRQPDQLISYYNCQWKSRNNHFHRRSDIKPKEERRPVVSELANQRGILQKASGWQFYHLSAQFSDMIVLEDSLTKRMERLQNLMSSKLRQEQPQLVKLHEIAQANKQRCSLTKDQLHEAKSSMFSMLDTHKPKILDIISKHHSKRPVKKKDRL